MSFLNRAKAAIQRFMIGRNGIDALANATQISSLTLLLLSLFCDSFVLSVLSCIGYGYTLFRMFSRNITKRSVENRKYLELRNKTRTAISQARVRMKNSKKYKYFKCPECKSWLRLPRNVGEVTVTCGKCRHAFKKKA